MVGTLLLGGKTRAELRTRPDQDRAAPLNARAVRLPQPAVPAVADAEELEPAAG